MTDERDKRNISNFIPYAVKRHSHRRKSASFKLKPVCLPRSGCFIAPWSWSLSWWRIGHTKQKQIFAHYYYPILPSLYYVLFLYLFRTGCNVNAAGKNNFVYQRLSWCLPRIYFAFTNRLKAVFMTYTDIWRCTYVTNSNFSFYSHITIIWHLTWEAWLQCSLSKLKKKDRKLVQMFSTSTTTIVPLPWRFVHFK